MGCHILNKFLSLLNLRLVKSDKYHFVNHKINEIKDSGRSNLLDLLSRFNQLDYENLLKYSKSQIGQDIFAISLLSGKKNGYFVEFGATDGIGLSNTYMLEKEFSWSGILAEPGKNWHYELIANRSCKIDFRCISDKTGKQVVFYESDSPELSTISGLEKSDSNIRKLKDSYNVETLSLNDLLLNHKAPKVIDLLSIDTEGSELSILESFNFDNYQFAIIVCEHNFTQNREKIFTLLTANGYKRVWHEFTQFDDWYILPELIDNFI
jgi:FkbM family methyltransferase